MNIADIERLIHEQRIEFVRFEQTDSHGISRSKTVPARHFRRFSEKGLNFLLGLLGFDVQAGLAPDTGYLEELGFPDGRIFPDLRTFQIVPWAEDTARVICEPYYLDGRPAMASPRLVVKLLLDELANLGYGLLSGFEYKFYLVDRQTGKPPFSGSQIFATLRNTFDEDLVYDILRGMSAAGVDIITANAEQGPGQMEFNFAPAMGVTAADQAFTFKNGVKEIAAQHGYSASFMTKPYAEQSASGCHFHHSLVNLHTGENAFGNADEPSTLSDVARRFLGGQIVHAPAICALAAPTVNCYKHYRIFSFSPTNATWGWENRTAGFRIKGLRGEGPHTESRLAGAAANPYLVMAATLAAGLDGLRNRIEPPAEATGVAYVLNGVANLPTRLDDALDALEADEPMKAALGHEFIKLFLAVKRHELVKVRQHVQNYDTEDFNDHVTAWERDEYFEFL